MTAEVAQIQGELRRKMLANIASQSQEDRLRRSEKILEKALGCLPFQKSRKIHVFMSLPMEVDTERLIDRAIQEGKRVMLPRADFRTRQMIWYEIESRTNDLRLADNGILEPDDQRAKRFNEKAECVFVPGVVFDWKKNRIGRGAGFYDRFLSNEGPGVFKIGLAFSFQIVEAFPVNAHDVPMDEVITDGD